MSILVLSAFHTFGKARSGLEQRTSASRQRCPAKEFSMAEPERKNPGDEDAPGASQTGQDICPACSGSGRLDQGPCPDCGGSGRITVIVGDA
jgi:DnaJ-class molecular chaperone